MKLEVVHQLAASRQPCRRAGVVWGELQLTVLGRRCWPHPSAGGLGQVAGGGGGDASRSVRGRHPSTRRVSSKLRVSSELLFFLKIC